MKYTDDPASEQNKAKLTRRMCRRFIVNHVKGNKYEAHFAQTYQDLGLHIRYVPITIQLPVLKDVLKALCHSYPDMDGFRIYPAVEAGKLVFVFCGMIQESDVAVYRILREDGSFSHLSKAEANSRVTQFQNTVGENYLNTIVADNTRSYMFGKGLIKDFIAELEFHTAASSIKKMRIRLGAYFDASDNPPGTAIDYRNRLLIGFSFVDSSGNEVGLDELSDPVFGCDIFESKAIGADTGTPCPPGPGCTTPSLGK